MNEPNSIETQLNLSKISLSDQTKFRLNEINKIKDYFNLEVRKREVISKKLSKYVAAFDYADKIFTVLSTTFATLSVVSHAIPVGIPVGLAGASLTVAFSLTTRVIKKLLNVTRKKKEKTIKLLCLLKAN